MRLILSRKGFDSSSGGCPSPIFPDGTMISLPIPDKRSPVRYQDLTWRGRNLGDVVEALTRGRVKRTFGAHLDPDLRRGALRRPAGWRPSLGQVGASQGHLRKQRVGPGDLFLFWGLFRRVDAALRWAGQPEHRIWGWMQVAEVAPVDDGVRDGGTSWRWARRHPHLQFDSDSSNTLYVAAPRLRVPGVRGGAGAAVFERAEDRHRLTADGENPSTWNLPADFLPRSRPPLTYHGDPGRWRRDGDHALLQTVAKGQEFVLDLDLYPGAARWLVDLVAARVPLGGRLR